jgi:hypothetical protein
MVPAAGGRQGSATPRSARNADSPTPVTCSARVLGVGSSQPRSSRHVSSARPSGPATWLRCFAATGSSENDDSGG